MPESPSSPSYKLRRPGGDIDPDRIINVPGVVLALTMLTIVLFALMVLAPERAGRIIEISAAVSPRRFLLGPAANGGYLGMVSPLIAHMFVHANIPHVALNSLFLLAFGAPIARRMGAEGGFKSFSAFASASLFLTFYLLCGVAGALTYIAMHTNEMTFLVGASGGVSGLLGALVRFAFNRSTLFGPENASLSSLMSSSVVMPSAVIIFMNIAIGLFGGILTGGMNIAWEAHIGGYMFGLLTYPIFEHTARSFHR